MENKNSAKPTNPLGMCEKVFNALKINPMFGSFRRIQYSSEPVAAPASPLLPGADSGMKQISVQSKLPSPPSPATESGDKTVSTLPKPPSPSLSAAGSSTKVGSVPLTPPAPSLPIANSGSKVASILPKPTSANPVSITGSPHARIHDKTQVEVGPVVTKPALPPPPPPPVSFTKQKGTPSEKGQVAKVATKGEPAAPVSAKQKEVTTKAEAALPTSSVAGLGKIKAGTNVALPPALQEESKKFTAKEEAALPTTIVGGWEKEKASNPEPEDRRGPKAVLENINDRVGNYINQAKIRLRAGSNVGRAGKSAGN